MSSFRKKILAAFVEVTGEEQAVIKREEVKEIFTTNSERVNSPAASSEKFKLYFDQLFKDANLPGPDYFEFSKMTEAMQNVADERARYSAAFAGLSVQGLDKQKLLQSATQYVEVLETDAINFNKTVDAALKEKVQAKQQEIEANAKRIEALAKEISELQNKTLVLQEEVKENEAKIENNSGAYLNEMQAMKNKILQDIEKIKQLVS